MQLSYYTIYESIIDRCYLNKIYWKLWHFRSYVSYLVAKQFRFEYQYDYSACCLRRVSLDRLRCAVFWQVMFSKMQRPFMSYRINSGCIPCLGSRTPGQKKAVERVNQTMGFTLKCRSNSWVFICGNGLDCKEENFVFRGWHVWIVVYTKTFSLE